jgi:AAA15 family ATPase/GTPase
LKVTRGKISNLFSYQNEDVNLENYNVVVGPNSSGKTNLLRIFELLTRGYPSPNILTPPETIALSLESIRLEDRFKLNTDVFSAIHLEIVLSEQEIKMILQLIIKRKLDVLPNYDNVKRINLVIYWSNSPNEYEDPSIILLRFQNGFSIWKVKNDIERVGLIKSLPELKDLHDVIISRRKTQIGGYTEDRFVALHGYSSARLLEIPTFQVALSEGREEIEKLFVLNGTTINIPFYHGGIQYNPNQPEQHAADILKFCKLELSAKYNIGLWIFLRFLMQHSIVILREMRPGYQELGYALHTLKTLHGSSSQFTELRRNFSRLFTNVEFDVFPKSNGANDNQFSIKKYEDSKEYDLEESASGYFETLILLLHVGTEKEDILIIDEPALHLHPIKIKQLGRTLSSYAKRQVILVTHSPYFVDLSLFKEKRCLISIQKDPRGISQIFNKIGMLALDLKPHNFNPEIFFKCNIFVEGPSDAAALMAISDSLNHILEKRDILIVDAGGKDVVEKYIEIIDT